VASIDIIQQPQWIPLTDTISPSDWRSGLRRFNNGAIIPQLANVIHAVKFAPEFAGVLAFDEFSLQTVTRCPAPWYRTGGEAWGDNDDRKLTEWAQHQGINIGVELAAHAVQAVAYENRFHPLRDWLTKLEWDREKRLDDWVIEYLGSDAGSEFARTAGAKFLISAVARVLRPGAKADCILVLEGPQGTGKSSAARILFSPYFCDHLPDLSSKDAFLQLRGIWGVEISELAALTRATVERVKGFLSASTDRYRPPYARRPIDVPRECVFIGTTNHDNYLLDESGNRRFWPLRCGAIDLKKLRTDRDQLFAEAIARFRGGEAWWLNGPTLNDAAQDEQERRLSRDAWHEIIESWIENPVQRFDESGHPIEPFQSTHDGVSVQDVLVHAIGKRVDAWTQIDANRVARTLRALKWDRVQRRERGKRVWRYVPVTSVTGPDSTKERTGDAATL
jgi:putative DNA primase/helicase